MRSAQSAASTVSGLGTQEELHWLALHLAQGLGCRKANQLLEQFESPEAIFRASRSELEAAGLARTVAQSIASGCDFEEAVEQQAAMAARGVALVTLHDPRYPAPLRAIFDPPIVLFARGRTELLDGVTIGVVGTRRPTPYGMAAAEKLARELSDAGLTIVSGMARGIDTAAHMATLDAGGDTIAVFGCGVDVIYPAENRKLAERIAEAGLLLSEFPMGTPGHPQNFPVRNRIISGMSAGVMVVEGAEYSGSAITARLALDQGREVFAVPGNITSRMSAGPNLLIRQGAKIVMQWTDVTAELKPEARARAAAVVRKRLEKKEMESPETFRQVQASLALTVPDAPVAALAKRVLAALKPDQAIHLDQLMVLFEGHSSSELIAALFELEMDGLAKQLPGRRFVAAWG